jgi:hypothetical protein
VFTHRHPLAIYCTKGSFPVSAYVLSLALLLHVSAELASAGMTVGRLASYRHEFGQTWGMAAVDKL